MKVLVFDTETTGLIPRRYTSMSENPYILQLACILYDTTEKKILDTMNDYVNIPENVEISEKVTQVNHIDKNILNEKGINILQVLNKFTNMFDNCDLIVGHNIEFDVKMIKIEFQRNNITLSDKMIQKMYKCYCTMRSGTAVCQIECENKYGKYFKFPKLEELYYHLFKIYPINMHDAYNDIIVCLQCYMSMEHQYIIDDNSFKVNSINTNSDNVAFKNAISA